MVDQHTLRLQRAKTRAQIICTRCVMDTTDPDITFDDAGVCNHCRRFDAQVKPILAAIDSGKAATILEQEVARIKEEGKGLKYDCVVGVSGGVDSSYVAYLAHRHGLRALCVHFDSGWNTEFAVRNIENILRSLDYDLWTHVVEWAEMRDLQVAFFRSGLPNCDTPTDHAIPGVLNRVARRFGIRTILSGSNASTESILPLSWAYHANDHRQLLDVHRRFGSVKLNTYPLIDFWQNYLIYPHYHKIRTFKILNYVSYNKREAKETIKSNLGWTDYGGKHEESIFTRFFQQYYLPARFGFDKRKPHLASLILSGQMTRDEALDELQLPPYNKQQVEFDLEFIAKKLAMSLDELKSLIEEPGVHHRSYRSLEPFFEIGVSVKRKLRHIGMSR
ncbi:N-acetyl sugar amidotransferase [Bosea sp. (in: a-proteobacteria)]